MADVNYSVVDFNDLSEVRDGKTLLYTDGQVCKSENNLSELIQSAVDKQVENKLDTSAFSSVSGNFLTAHQQIPESANWTETYETVTANSETWNNVSNIKSFTSIAGIEAETSADSLQITAGDNVSITTANKTITISAKDTTYGENDFISASHLENIELASGYATDWNTNKSNVELASGYAKVWSDNSATIIANGNSGFSALNTITTNSSTWTKVTALSEGSNVKISNDHENYTIGVSGVVTSASDSLNNKLLVLYNNQWQELNETGAFEVVELNEDDEPNVSDPDQKVIYLTKEDGSTKTDPYTEWIYSDKWEIIGETSVPISDYYKKTETSSKDQLSTEFEKKLDSSVAQTTYAPIDLTATVNTLSGSSATWNEVSAKVDTSSMSAYYTKFETSGSTEISDALSGKEDKIFVAVYNNNEKTSFADIKAAYDAGKKIYLKLDNFSAENPSGGGSPYNYIVPLNDFYTIPGGSAPTGVDYYIPTYWFQFDFLNDGNPHKLIIVKINDNDSWSTQVIPLDYYTKSETSAAGEISDALDLKENKITAGTDIKIENDTISVNNMDCSAVTNNYSVAIGLSTSALSYGSFTQGENTLADIGRAAHAEGLATQALANYSHSEGSNTVASGEDSHSEGYYTRATERYSHAEGRATYAQGEDSHAEGYSTSAVGKHAHAEGEYTKAKGETSHSEGYDTSAIGNYAHAEGYQTIANSNYSHSEGQETSAIGICSHAEGYKTKAGSMYMHVCGKFNQTSSNALFVVGNGASNDNRSDAFIIDLNGNTSANDFISYNNVSLSGMIDLYNILTARPSSGTYTLKCVNGILSWVEDSNVPANAVGLNNEPVGVNGDYFTVGEGQ